MRPLAFTLAAALAVSTLASGCAAIRSRAAQADQAAAVEQPVNLPAPVTVRLANGLTLLVIERHNLPIVSINAVVRAGDAQDPADKSGVADLTADMLTRGAGDRSAPQVAEAIDFVGGSFQAASEMDSTHASVSVLKKDLTLGLGLLSDALERPSFAPQELARAKEEEAAALNSSLDDGDQVAQLAFTQDVLRGHAYGIPTTLSSVARIGREDIAAFYQAYYTPNNTFMAVVGDITPEEAKARFEATFGAWQSRPVPAIALQAPTASSARKVILVDMPVNQSYIRLGNVAVKRNTPDFYALQVLNFILGGDFTSRLNQRIRDKQGLAYGASSGFSMDLYGGTFSASLNTRSEKTAQALHALLAELRRIQDEPVSAQELRTAQDAITGAFPLRFETNADLASEVVNLAFYGLPADYLATYRQRIRAVSAADIQRVAREYLHPDAYTLVVAAQAPAVAQALEEFGPLTRLQKQALIR